MGGTRSLHIEPVKPHSSGIYKYILRDRPGSLWDEQFDVASLQLHREIMVDRLPLCPYGVQCKMHVPLLLEVAYPPRIRKDTCQGSDRGPKRSQLGRWPPLAGHWPNSATVNPPKNPTALDSLFSPILHRRSISILTLLPPIRRLSAAYSFLVSFQTQVLGDLRWFFAVHSFTSNLIFFIRVNPSPFRPI